MQDLIDWLKAETNKLEYGNVIINITIYQGDIVGIEKQVIDKKKYQPGEKLVDK